MSSSFSFNLRNDDIEDDADDDDKPVSTANVRESSKVPAAEPKLHTLGDMVRSPALSWHINTYCRLRSILSDSSRKEISSVCYGFSLFKAYQQMYLSRSLLMANICGGTIIQFLN